LTLIFSVCGVPWVFNDFQTLLKFDGLPHKKVELCWRRRHRSRGRRLTYISGHDQFPIQFLAFIGHRTHSTITTVCILVSKYPQYPHESLSDMSGDVGAF